MNPVRTFFQGLAFFFPSPVNIWLHRLAGARIERKAFIHPGVLLLAKNIEIGAHTKIRFGTFVHVRSFHVGQKCLLGYFIIVKGLTDLSVGDACTIGPKTMINCDCPVTLGYYCGIGPGCTLFTHGSFLPVTEGYRVTFGPIEMKSKSWVTMSSTVGPGVTIGEGTNVMPGTVLVQSVGAHRLVSGNPAKLVNIPMFLNRKKNLRLDEVAHEILTEYCNWCKQFDAIRPCVQDGQLRLPYKNESVTVTIDGGGDIDLLTEKNATRNGMYFNLADLTTDNQHHPVKVKLEEYMRLYYGLTFIELQPTR